VRVQRSCRLEPLGAFYAFGSLGAFALRSGAMSDEKTLDVAWQDLPIASRIADYLGVLSGAICEQWKGPTDTRAACETCGLPLACHLLRDAQRELTKLTVLRLDEEPVKAHEDLTVTIAAPHNHD
jgi:hypothetical protein